MKWLSIEIISRPNEVEANGKRYSANHVLIATGGRPHIPDFEGNDLVIDSDGFFELEKQPRKVVNLFLLFIWDRYFSYFFLKAIVGAGYIAVELAGIFRSLGSEVSLLIRNDKVLRTFDDLIADNVTELLVAQGVDLQTHRYLSQKRQLLLVYL